MLTWPFSIQPKFKTTPPLKIHTSTQQAWFMYWLMERWYWKTGNIQARDLAVWLEAQDGKNKIDMDFTAHKATINTSHEFKYL